MLMKSGADICGGKYFPDESQTIPDGSEAEGHEEEDDHDAHGSLVTR